MFMISRIMMVGTNAGIDVNNALPSLRVDLAAS